MPRPGDVGGIVPAGDDAIGRKLADLQRQIDALSTARTLNAATIQGGTLTLLDGVGNIVAEIGQLTGGAVDDIGFRLLRTDPGVVGTTAFRFRGGSIGLRDAQNQDVVSDDITSGHGLGNPWIPLDQPHDTNVATWPQTTNTAWTGIASSWVQKQNPGFRWSLFCQADAGTTAQFRINVDGTVIATSPTVTGTFSMWTAEYYWPAGWGFNNTATLGIEAQVTAGAGPARAQLFQLTGRASP